MEKTPNGVRFRCVAGVEHFDRDLAIHGVLAGAVDHAHAAFAQHIREGELAIDLGSHPVGGRSADDEQAPAVFWTDLTVRSPGLLTSLADALV